MILEGTKEARARDALDRVRKGTSPSEAAPRAVREGSGCHR